MVDQVIGDYGTTPNDDLNLELKSDSRHEGQVDLDALARFDPQTIDQNPDDAFFVSNRRYLDRLQRARGAAGCDTPVQRSVGDGSRLVT